MINKAYFPRFIVWTETDPCDIFYISKEKLCSVKVAGGQ